MQISAIFIILQAALSNELQSVIPVLPIMGKERIISQEQTSFSFVMLLFTAIDMKRMVLFNCRDCDSQSPAAVRPGWEFFQTIAHRGSKEHISLGFHKPIIWYYVKLLFFIGRALPAGIRMMASLIGVKCL
jgi:hypothetical protein